MLRPMLDPLPSGIVEGECPYCGSTEPMHKHRVLPRWIGFVLIFPSAELLVCPVCRGVARDESLLDRAMSAIFLLPFLAVTLGGVGVGLYLIGAMIVDRRISAAWTGISVFLVAAGSYSGFRAARGLRRLVSRRKMLPIAGWTGTDL